MNKGQTTTLAIATSCTVFLVHTIITLFIGDLSSAAQWMQIFVTTLASAAFISVATKAIAAFLSGQIWLFKLIMGKQYIRGTWIGTIMTEGGSKVLFVEHYDQTTFGLTIHGWNFYTAEPKYYARWTTQCAVIDSDKGRMDCLYETHVPTEGKDKDIRYGTGRFNIIARENNGAPKRMQGIAVDEYHSAHLTYETVERLDDKLLDIEDAFEKALDKFGQPNPVSKTTEETKCSS